MIVFLNGEFLAADQAKVSIFDRSFLYGDGLFETFPVFNGVPVRLDQHWQRLNAGAQFLQIALPFSLPAIREALHGLRTRNGFDNAIVRLTLSRGVGARGYSLAGADHPVLAMSWHEMPEGLGRDFVRWPLIYSSQVVPVNQPYTRYKTANKLCALLAKAEAEAAGAQEALIFNTQGRVAEATAANLFWVKDNATYTPPLSEGALEGISRATVQALCQSLKVRCSERMVTPSKLLQADALFLTLSTWGIVEVSRLPERELPTSPFVRELWNAYWQQVKAATAV